MVKLGVTTTLLRTPLSLMVSNTTSVLTVSPCPLSVISCPGLAEACAALTAVPVVAVALRPCSATA